MICSRQCCTCYFCFFPSSFLALLAASILPLLYKYEAVVLRQGLGLDFPESLAGHTVLVTGSASGIGFHVACEFYRRGALVIVTGQDWRRTNEAAMYVQAAHQGGIAVASSLFTGAATGLTLDMADLNDVRRFSKEVISRFPRLDIVVFSGAGPEDWLGNDTARQGSDFTQTVNYIGHFLLYNLLRPHFAPNPKLVFIGSVGMWLGDLDRLKPALQEGEWESKLALHCFAQSLRERLSGRATVSFVVPGRVATDTWPDELETRPSLFGWLAPASAAGRLIADSAFVASNVTADVVYAFWFPRAFFARYQSANLAGWRREWWHLFLLPAFLQRATYGALHASVGPTCGPEVREELWQWSAHASGLAQ